MSFYLLPQIHNNLNLQNIELIVATNECNIIISKSLHNYLNTIKKQIDVHSKDWDIYKKYTNPYEYIHTAIPYLKQSVCKLKPLSRSFFKLIEIINLLNLMDLKNSLNE